MKIKMSQKKYLLSGRHRFFSPLFIFLCSFLVIIVLIFFAGFYIRKTQSFLPSVSSLYKSWNKQDYQSVYDNSGLILDKRPLDGTVLALHGFSSYYLFAEQTDSAIAQNFLADSINSLRNAWYRVSESEKPQIAYVLGKAYYQKGYYYADLAMKYLDYAYKAGIHSGDIQEFRGLSAALLGDNALSIAAFTDALSVNTSDLLLFAIAKSYEKVNDQDKAKQYLYETIRTTKDDLLILKSYYELGMIFLTEQKIPEAQAEFDTILEKEPNSADAHYGLGVIYEAQGDLIRARAEWRKAVKMDPLHVGARAKLNIS
jgi:tetratricopeptide (TPR) repeat protein